MKTRIVLTHVNLASSFGSSERQLLLLIRALAAYPLEQALVVRKGSGLEHEALQREIKVIAQGWVKNSEPALNSDLVHAYGSSDSWQWAKGSKQQFVVSLDSTEHLHKKSLQASRCALVYCRSLQDRIHASLMQLPIERVAPMYDDRVLSLSTQQLELRAKFSDSFVIGLCTNCGNDSGLDYAIAAMRWLATRNHQAHLLMVSDSSFPRAVPTEIGTLKNITLVENQRDTTSWYKLFDAYASPATSAFDDQGVVQAMYSGLPIVSTRLESMDDFVQDQHSALLVSSRDAQAFGQAILKVIEDSVTALRLGATAQSRAEKYSPKLIADKTFRLYQSVVSNTHLR